MWLGEALGRVGSVGPCASHFECSEECVPKVLESVPENSSAASGWLSALVSAVCDQRHDGHARPRRGKHDADTMTNPDWVCRAAPRPQ